MESTNRETGGRMILLSNWFAFFFAWEQGNTIPWVPTLAKNPKPSGNSSVSCNRSFALSMAFQ